MSRLRLGSDLALGGVFVVFGIGEALRHVTFEVGATIPRLLVGVAMGAAVGLHRREPGLAIGLVWFACGTQVVWGLDIMLVEFGVVIVGYGAARYGSIPTVWASALSIPAAYGIAAVSVRRRGTEMAQTLGISELTFQDVAPAVVIIATSGAVPLVVPWLIGMVLRMQDRTRVVRQEQMLAEYGREQAEEIARVREEQARLARDVHDVVGHSLAVILAQAEAARFLPDDDPDRFQATMTTIAGAARASLGDVRRVLSATADEYPAAPPGDGESLISGVRASGIEVEHTVSGTPRQLPADHAVVVYRVLQEMLTNALKHGRKGEPLSVAHSWDHALEIEVRNATDADPGPAGRGVEGMRRRLESLGGGLVADRVGDAFVARARLPLPARPNDVVPGDPSGTKARVGR